VIPISEHPWHEHREVPSELLRFRQWVLYRNEERNGRETKVPYDPQTGKLASTRDPHTWSDYRQARAVVNRLGMDGLGFVFTARDPYCGVDLDDCFDNCGQIKPRARRIVEMLNSYTERSPSGKGLHILVKAKLPTGRHPKGLGLFSEGRYFTMSGRHVPNTPLDIQDRQHEIESIYAEINPPPTAQGVVPVLPIPHRTDREILERGLQNEKFGRLYREGARTGEDHSALDLALVNLLRFFGATPEQADRLFRASALVRPKWDQGGRLPYGRRTIIKAFSATFMAYGTGRQAGADR
jgi:putative DNA primase/helicase